MLFCKIISSLMISIAIVPFWIPKKFIQAAPTLEPITKQTTEFATFATTIEADSTSKIVPFNANSNVITETAESTIVTTPSSTTTTTTITTNAASQSTIFVAPQIRFGEVIPVNLLNPCQIEDENWSETYFLEQQPNNERYEHDSTDQASIDYPDELVAALTNDENDLDNQTTTSIDNTNAEAKVTLTRLANRRRFGFDLLTEMIRRAHVLQSLVTDMIRKHLITECRSLNFHNLMEIPDAAFEHSDLVYTVTHIYQTLANQTAHLYYIWTEQRRQSTRRNGCDHHWLPSTSADHERADPSARKWSTYFKKRMHARRVADDFLLVSSNLRAFMCNFKRAFQLFEIDVPTAAIVQRVVDQPTIGRMSCARMAVLDCHLMKSSIRVFASIEKFLRLQSTKFINYRKTSLQRHKQKEKKQAEVKR